MPALDEATTLGVVPRFPQGVRMTTPVQSGYAAGTAVQRWRIEADGGLVDKAIDFSNLSTARIDVLVRLERADGSVQLGRVLALDPRFVVTASPGAFEVVQTYTVLGIEHILLGIDHLLFVLALLLLVNGFARLVATVTAFTLAHSITLGAATLGFVHVPPAPVEAVIALSILFLASELARRPPVGSPRARLGDTANLTTRFPWIVAFAFGLLHGFGFAGALSEIGVPQQAVPLALLFFNVGVELGQLMFIGAVFTFAWLVQLSALRMPAVWQRAVAYGIGSVAAFWVVERTIAIF